MSIYFDRKKIIHYQNIPRLPLLGALDLTYRCNNNCRHCWRWEPDREAQENQELSYKEIRKIVDAARAMGCRMWSISGGEPMIRPDFIELLDYISRRSSGYDLNTNGTLITPRIARLMRRKGSKKIALCGATAKVHDHITRNPGSFEATLQGCAYLKEAGANFIVQLIPMRDNFHQYGKMVELAGSLSPAYRVGADFFYLTACGSPQRNNEILRQRLAPNCVRKLEPPAPSFEDGASCGSISPCHSISSDDRVFATCIANRRNFHVDPYGGLSFCIFISDPKLRYDLRTGSFREGWEKFIPSLAQIVRGSREYLEGCAICALRQDCRWCPAYAYLEHCRYGAKVKYLCQLARDAVHFKKRWKRHHRRYYEVAGITIQLDSDRPIRDEKMDPRFRSFWVKEPGQDVIRLRRHFSLPDLNQQVLGQEVYRQKPWAVYRKDSSWIYISPPSWDQGSRINRVAVFDQAHSRGRIYNPEKEVFRKAKPHSLTFFSTDQIILARILADRQGLILHSSAFILEGQGLMFLGHSGAGKSSLSKLLLPKAQLLCDDRNIVRRSAEGFRVYGTWSHGEVPQVSSASAPLRAFLFLHQADENRIVPLKDRNEITRRLLACLIKPLVTPDWWKKVLDTVEWAIREIPSYDMYFDLSGEIVKELEIWLQGKGPKERER